MKILDRGDDWIAFHKEGGFHVHPPEDGEYPPPRDRICLYIARDIAGKHVYPVHRLDAGTSGVLLFALSSETAAKLSKQFQERDVRKTYHAVVRGWTPEDGRIDLPLESDSSDELADCLTIYRRLATAELDAAVGTKHPTARYSLLELEPRTGRYHQLRRHLNRISHPIIGDSEHGDSRHNRFFRETLGLPGLCLRATELRFRDPSSGAEKVVTDVETEQWSRIARLFNRNGKTNERKL